MKNKNLFLSLLILSNSSIALNDKSIIINNSLSPEVSIIFDNEKNKNVIKVDAPNKEGVSLNFYHKFDVPKQGVILNNKNAKADVIINEVTGNEISFINGNVMVEGKKAHVFIANPNGIECNQCSASRVTDFTLISGKTTNGLIRFLLSEKNYVSISGIKKVANKKINIISNKVFMEGVMNKSINTLNILSGLHTYNAFTGNIFNSNGQISFFEGFKHSLNQVNISHGYGEVYIDKDIDALISHISINDNSDIKSKIYLGG